MSLREAPQVKCKFSTLPGIIEYDEGSCFTRNRFISSTGVRPGKNVYDRIPEQENRCRNAAQRTGRQDHGRTYGQHQPAGKRKEAAGCWAVRRRRRHLYIEHQQQGRSTDLAAGRPRHSGRTLECGVAALYTPRWVAYVPWAKSTK